MSTTEACNNEIPTNEQEKEERRKSDGLEEEDIPFDNPHDLPLWRKWTISALLALVTFTSTFASSIFSSTIGVTSKLFGVSETVMILGVSLYVLGFATGPLLWGPLSEVHGRKLPLFTGVFLFAVFQIPLGLVDSLAGILVCRFLVGCFGSAPVVLVTATYSDIWTPVERGTAAAVYGLAAYAGPTIGPIVGSFLTYSSLGWRWTAWLPLCMAGVFGTLAWMGTPETYVPVLRERAAKRLGRELKTPSDNMGFIRKYVSRPVEMLAVEPLLDVITLYVSVVYGLLYLSFYAVPYTFQQRGWKPDIATLPFLSLLLGVILGCFFLHIFTRTWYAPRLKRRQGRVRPEDRLVPIMIGSIVLPIGLFWFAWTGTRNVHWIASTISIFFIGFGIMSIFSNGIQYIIDVYLPYAASASSANCVVRSFVAAGVPLAAPRMYSDLGSSWATSTLAFVCLAMTPFPFLFWRYGQRIRHNSTFAQAY